MILVNKHQRAKSRFIKMHIKLSEIFTGRRPSYKEAKRKVRAYCRFVKSWKSPVSFEKPNLLGNQASVYIIDETPVEATQMWPKENPNFERRYLGKFVGLKEDFNETV